MERHEKDAKIGELHAGFGTTVSAVLVNFQGLTVAQVDMLRRKMREANVHYEVVKNKLAQKAANETGFSALSAYFKGPTGIALSFDDPAAPAKVLTGLQKELDKLTFKVAIVDNVVYGPEAVPDIAKMPSKNDLRAQFLGVLEAPLTDLLSLLQAPARDLLLVLEAYRAKREENQ